MIQNGVSVKTTEGKDFGSLLTHLCFVRVRNSTIIINEKYPIEGKYIGRSKASTRSKERNGINGTVMKLDRLYVETV